MVSSKENPNEPGLPVQDGPAHSKKKVWLNIVVLGVLASFAAATIVMQQGIKTKAKVDQPVPDLNVEDMSGRPVSLKDFLGGPVLLNLWTSWCTSCKEETPALQAFHERYGDKMKLIGLNVREPLDTIQEYMTFYGADFLVLRDKNGDASKRYNVRGYPESWFIDKDGIARVYWEGPMTFEMMQEFYRETTGRPIDEGRVGAVAPGNRLRAVGLVAGAAASAPALYAGTDDGLFTSADGKEWGLTETKPLSGGSITGLVFPAKAPGLALAAGPNIGVWRSRDGGRTWQETGRGLPAKDVRALAADPSGRDVYAWVAGSGLHHSGDGGDSWQAVAGLDGGLPVAALGVDPRNPGRVLLSAAREGTLGWQGRLLESSDGGRTWREVQLKEEIRGIVFEPAVLGMAFDPVSPGTVYFATSKGIWVSKSGGSDATWLRKSHMRVFVSIAAAGGSGGRTMLLAGAPNGDVYLSEDGGAAWRLPTR